LEAVSIEGTSPIAYFTMLGADVAAKHDRFQAFKQL
jgi:hypothetical protein